MGNVRDEQLSRDAVDVSRQRLHRGRYAWELRGDAEVALTPKVVSLQVHEGHGRPMRSVTEAHARVGGGILGDSHVDRTQRAVTVVDLSTHESVGVEPGDLREQITVEGLPKLGDLAEGTRLRIGAITLRVNGPCDPCTHIGEMNGVADPDEFQSMLEGRRGLVCNVVAADGPIRVGDEVRVMETAASH